MNVYVMPDEEPSSPFKGEAGRGMGETTTVDPIPTPASGHVTGEASSLREARPALAPAPDRFANAVSRAPLPHQGGGGTHVWKFSSDLHCADCDIHYNEPTPSLFSFNSPVGACDDCRGFGRVIGIDFGLIVPDESKSIRDGAVRPWQTPSFSECQDDILKYAKLRGIPLDTPWRDLTAKQKHWVLEGEDEWVSWRKSWPGTWYGVRHFFKWLESKAYKMHIRVLLSKYRAYTTCTTCDGARLKPDALAWRLGSKADADSALKPTLRYKPKGTKFDDEILRALPEIGRAHV